MPPNAHPLIKRFDMFIVPDAEHNVVESAYVVQLTWDYFVRYLMGVTPPDDIVIRGPGSR